MQISIRRAVINDVDQIRFLFRDTVTLINSVDYKQDEIEVWADCYKNINSWIKSIKDQYFLVATINNSIVGFGSITDNGYLDFMYVHKDFQGKGVAKKLLIQIEMQADKLQVNTIFSHVSKTARPFFEKNGFIKTGEQINRVSNIEFVNSVMEKTLTNQVTIVLSDYNPDWAMMFISEKQLISAGFPIKDFLIEHIGSTSVPDLKAKPVIDILIGVPALPVDITATASYFKTLGYEYIEKYNLVMPERRFFQKHTNGKPSHHIHMVATFSDFWNRHLFFRNQLRENSAIRQQYEKLKTDLSKQQWDSSNDYANAKSDFIKSIINAVDK